MLSLYPWFRITDADANATQFVCYMPFGQAFVDEHTTRAEMPFKFNGKEQDAETGLYYYGARYYDPLIAVWYGVDLLGEKYPNMSTFAYCFNSPVKFVDPDGRTGYVIDSEGNISPVNDEGVDENGKNNFDVLYKKETYSEENRKDYDNTGKKEGIIVDDIKLLHQLANKTNVAEWEGTPWGYSDETGFVSNTKNRDDAYRVFKFAAENSNVEWSYQRYTDGTCAVTTSNKNSLTLTGLYHISNKNKIVAADIHSHPNTYRADLKPSQRDLNWKDTYVRNNPNAKVQLYIPKVTNPNGRMLDLVHNRWIIKY